MTKCCGDAHLLNFGMFAAPDRRQEGAGRAAARRCASSYRTEMARAVQRRRKEITKAERRTSLKVMTKFCDQVDGEYRIRPDHPVIVRFPIERNPEMFSELRSAT